MMDFNIQEYEINAFFRKQEELYDEFEEKTDATKYKIKQVVLKILSDANIIKSTNEKILMKPLVESTTAKLILIERDETYLKALLMDRHEIEMIKGTL
jgi:hypothetical protein